MECLSLYEAGEELIEQAELSLSCDWLRMELFLDFQDFLSKKGSFYPPILSQLHDERFYELFVVAEEENVILLEKRWVWEVVK